MKEWVWLEGSLVGARFLPSFTRHTEGRKGSGTLSYMKWSMYHLKLVEEIAVKWYE